MTDFKTFKEGISELARLVIGFWLFLGFMFVITLPVWVIIFFIWR